MTRRLALAVGMIALGMLPAKTRLLAQAEPRLAFIGVALDAATRQADQRLTEYLREKVGVAFSRDELEYEQVIERVVKWRSEDGPFLARMTPYAYVVAELLGASVEPLATYVSMTTSKSTYKSYFVVQRRDFSAPPELPDLLKFLTGRATRAKFVYQSPFSTSSFFLPSLYFRSHRIFQMAESLAPLTAISAARIADASSTNLVELVARGDADVAAVWDGVKARFEPGGSHAAMAREVYFIALPTPIPNDFLVSPTGLDPVIKNKMRQAIGAMPSDAISLGDFRSWQNINESTDARLALGSLRQAARAAVAPVTVEILLAEGAAGQPGAARLADAARQAVRLSETEFVLYDSDFHRHFDFRWTLDLIHDGAVLLRSTIPGAGVDEQSFQLSFRDEQDLTSRIVSVIQSRLHRIRYVWPYSSGPPSVIRDSAFALPEGAPVKVQRITWIDPERNEFREGPVFASRIQRASFYSYELPPEDFNQPAGGERIDPMSNAAYRVILMRPAEQPWLFRLLTMALVGCFVLAGASAAWTVSTRPRPRSSSGSGRG